MSEETESPNLHYLEYKYDIKIGRTKGTSNYQLIRSEDGSIIHPNRPDWERWSIHTAPVNRRREYTKKEKNTIVPPPLKKINDNKQERFATRGKYAALGIEDDGAQEHLQKTSRKEEAIELFEKIHSAYEYLDKNASMKDTRTVNIYDKNLLLKKARILQFQNGPFFAYIGRLADRIPELFKQRIETSACQRSSNQFSAGNERLPRPPPFSSNKIFNTEKTQERNRKCELNIIEKDIKRLQRKIVSTRDKAEEELELFGCNDMIPWKE